MISITKAIGFCEVGKRKTNEDFILFNEHNKSDNRIVVLCDGMGGHSHGEIASHTVAKTVFEYLKLLNKENYIPEDLQDALNASLKQLHVIDIYPDNEKRMGTTLVVAVINNMNIHIGHVGDSRCYLFDKDGNKKFRTKDHSKVAEAIDAEILTEKEARENSHKNLLTRSVMSGKTEVKIEIDTIEVEDEDILFLCSDGVVDAMCDDEIQAVLINRSPEESLSILKEECNLKSQDNFSAILIQFSQNEVNPPKKSTIKPVKDSLNIQTKQCPTCETANILKATYCTNCGCRLQIYDIDNNNTSIHKIKHHVPDWLPQVPLLLYIVAFIAGYACAMLFSGDNRLDDHQRQKANQDYVKEMSQNAVQFYRKEMKDKTRTFIDSLCIKDTLNNQSDSIGKEMLKRAFHSLLETIN